MYGYSGNTKFLNIVYGIRITKKNLQSIIRNDDGFIDQMDILGIYEELKNSIIASVFGIVSLFKVVRLNCFEIDFSKASKVTIYTYTFWFMIILFCGLSYANSGVISSKYNDLQKINKINKVKIKIEKERKVEGNIKYGFKCDSTFAI